MSAPLKRTLAANIKEATRQEVSVMVGELGRRPSDDELATMVFQALADNTSHSEVGAQEAQTLARDLLDDMLHFGPLRPLLADPSVTEICVNGFDKVFVERSGQMRPTSEISFDDEAHLRRIINQIAQGVDRRIDENSPRLDARMEDGSRVNAVIAPIALDGSSLTIRRFPETRMSAHDLVELGSASRAMMEFLAAATKGRCSIVVAGGTGGGKTTLLNVLSAHIPEHERIVTIEDTAELRFNHDDMVRLEARPANIEGKGEVSIHDLVINALRMRPDRIIVGECRKTEAIEMIRAMTTGHDGSLTTIHADDVQTVYHNLEGMILEAAPSFSESACRRKIAQAIDLVVVVNRKSGGARIVESITAINGMEKDIIQSEPLFEFVQTGIAKDRTPVGYFKGCGIQCGPITSKIQAWGVDYDPSWMFDESERVTHTGSGPC